MDFFYVYGYFANMSVCAPLVHLVTLETRKGHQPPWSWSYRSLWASIEVVQIELWSLGRAASAHNPEPSLQSYPSLSSWYLFNHNSSCWSLLYLFLLLVNYRHKYQLQSWWFWQCAQKHTEKLWSFPFCRVNLSSFVSMLFNRSATLFFACGYPGTLALFLVRNTFYTLVLQQMLEINSLLFGGKIKRLHNAIKLSHSCLQTDRSNH